MKVNQLANSLRKLALRENSPTKNPICGKIFYSVIENKEKVYNTKKMN